jgi:hypothetical protein
MIRLIPSVPHDCNVVGTIYWDDAPAVLSEDMLEVTLPNGVLVSCGWYPEGNPAGSYRITASEGFDELRRIETANIAEACSIVEELCRMLRGPAIFLSASSFVRVQVCV